jgi:hypothetical protein
MTDEARGAEPIFEVHDEAARMCICHLLEPGEECPACDLTDPLTERERELADLQEGCRWFAEALSAAHAEGRIDSEAVRFYIAEGRDPVTDVRSFYGRAQAYSYTEYVDGTPTRIVAGEMDLAIQLIEHADRALLVAAACRDLSVQHAREMMARATARTPRAGPAYPPAG